MSPSLFFTSVLLITLIVAAWSWTMRRVEKASTAIYISIGFALGTFAIGFLTGTVFFKGTP